MISLLIHSNKYNGARTEKNSYNTRSYNLETLRKKKILIFSVAPTFLHVFNGIQFYHKRTLKNQTLFSRDYEMLNFLSLRIGFTSVKKKNICQITKLVQRTFLIHRANLIKKCQKSKLRCLLTLKTPHPPQTPRIDI